MKTKFAGNTRLHLGLGLAGLLACLVAAPPRARADEGDPPSRAARVSYVEGSVSIQPGGSGDWGAAAKNRPTAVGDKLWTDKDSRAELQAGQASIHMGSMTALSFLNLDENVMQVRVAEGAINFRVRELREGDVYEVDTPNLAFTVKQAGAFRVEVSEDGEGTRVTAIRGEGEITAGGQTYQVHAGEMAELNGTDNPEYHAGQAAPPDGLDRWAAERDLREDNSTSAKYVSRDTPGYSDLDDYGRWNEEPEYGPVWYPTTVAVGWAPYSYGYWNWIGPWGWTWIGYEPWGFAPFHYGRWAFIGGRWGWCPGPYFVRPVYGPAFVGFFGGGHFGVGFGFGGGVGWFPLGFGEPFHPWFHCGRGFVERINVRNTVIRNTTIINNTHFNYVNARNVHAVTVASRNAFVNGQAINRTSVHVTPASLRGAQVTNAAGLSPTRSSSFGAVNARARVATPSAAVQNRTVMARTAPGAAASHMPVRTINSARLTPARPTATNNLANRTSVNPGRPGFGNNSATASRQNQLSQNRPPSASAAMNNNARPAIGRSTVNSNGNAGTHTWEAQGNTTDRGRAPQGFGSGPNANRPNSTVNNQNGTTQGARFSRSDRPPWAGSGSNGAVNGAGRSTGAATFNNSHPSSSNSNRSYQPSPSYSNAGRSYQPPSRPYSNGTSNNRSYEPPSRSYSAPRSTYPSSRPSYSAPAPRTYSAPSPSYSAPSRNYSAPSHSYSAPSHSSGGGSYQGGGGSHSGSVSHGGGGGRH
jgi:hypothetical protein